MAVFDQRGGHVENQVNISLNVLLSGESGSAAEPTQSRREHLEQRLRESQARCAARWLAVGLTEQQASRWARSQLGAPPAELLPSLEHPIRLLVGDLGAGKSLMAERAYQQAIATALSDEHAPVPISIRSLPPFGKQDDVLEKLQELIAQRASGIGDPHQQGAMVIIDGLDEHEHRDAFQLLQAARILVGIWPSTTVLLTSRPLPQFRNDIPERIDVPPLSDDAVLSLVNRFSMHPRIRRYNIEQLPKSMREAVQRPFFALLLGLFIEHQNGFYPSSTAQLLTTLIDKVYEEARLDPATDSSMLQRLAVRCIDRTGGTVPIAEVATQAELEPLLTSRLLVGDTQRLGFSLQIFAEWFAAQSLIATGTPTPEELVSDPQRLERWKYALIIFAGIASVQQATTYFSVLASEHPGFAVEVITEGIEKWAPPDSGDTLPPTLECGRHIQEAMRAWVRGVGPLAQLIAPVDEDGNVRPVGVQVFQNTHLAVSWYCGQEPIADVVPLTLPVVNRKDWPALRSSSPARQSAWAWRWTLQDLTDELSRVLDKRRLPIEHGSLWQETMWNIAKAVAQHYSVYPRPIAVDTLEEYLADVEHRFDRVGFSSVEFTPMWLRKQVNLLHERGISEVTDPWLHIRPPAKGSTIDISDKAALEYARSMLLGAMNSYQDLVHHWCPRLARRLRIAVILPARLIGVMKRFQAPREHHIFRIRWYWEALPPDQPNSVDIQMGDLHFDEHLYERSQQQLHAQRPEAASWLRAIIWGDSLNLYESYPATDQVYQWLWQDLQDIGLVGGILGHPRTRYFY